MEKRTFTHHGETYREGDQRKSSQQKIDRACTVHLYSRCWKLETHTPFFNWLSFKFLTTTSMLFSSPLISPWSPEISWWLIADQPPSSSCWLPAVSHIFGPETYICKVYVYTVFYVLHIWSIDRLCFNFLTLYKIVSLWKRTNTYAEYPTIIQMLPDAS